MQFLVEIYVSNSSYIIHLIRRAESARTRHVSRKVTTPNSEISISQKIPTVSRVSKLTLLPRPKEQARFVQENVPFKFHLAFVSTTVYREGTRKAVVRITESRQFTHQFVELIENFIPNRSTSQFLSVIATGPIIIPQSLIHASDL
jgi:hypothetical protein